jgi:hypothetical protein
MGKIMILLITGILSYKVLAVVILAAVGLYIFSNLIPYPKLQISLKLLVCLAILVSVFFTGIFYATEQKRQEVQQLQVRVALAEQQALDLNQQLAEKSAVKTRTIRLKAKTIREYIDREVRVLDSSCTIPTEFIQAHNRAAQK